MPEHVPWRIRLRRTRQIRQAQPIRKLRILHPNRQQQVDRCRRIGGALYNIRKIDNNCIRPGIGPQYRTCRRGGSIATIILYLTRARQRDRIGKTDRPARKTPTSTTCCVRITCLENRQRQKVEQLHVLGIRDRQRVDQPIRDQVADIDPTQERRIARRILIFQGSIMHDGKNAFLQMTGRQNNLRAGTIRDRRAGKTRSWKILSSIDIPIDCRIIGYSIPLIDRRQPLNPGPIRIDRAADLKREP